MTLPTKLLTGLMLVLLVPLVSVRAESTHPNIILMMADDMGMGDTSAYQDFTGNSDADQLHTPQMERLARLGVRFTDAHTPSSRCTTTRYGLLTGRYSWRNRLKYWVLFGAQGDPMIERDRPTIASLLKDAGYRTSMVGKWHVGLRYRRSDGHPAAGWDDADLTKPLFDSPLDHGFDNCWFTSRSHGTSGPSPGGKKQKNGPQQTIGPGHIDGRLVLSATNNGHQLKDTGPDAYVLKKLGSRHSDRAVAYLTSHVNTKETAARPFFLYYACNSNHGPYTPDDQIAGRPVAGASRNVAGKPMNVRSDFIYENDVALGRLLDWLKSTDDARNPGRKLIENTVVIFTSDNGAERNSNVSTGPFRSHKGSTYEGGHRVPFIVSWPAGNVGDGDAETPGKSSDALIGLQDMFATFADLTGQGLPDLAAGDKGGEDSRSVLAAWQGESIPGDIRFFNDHKEAKDQAVAAVRIDDPIVHGKEVPGKWKLFFDAAFLRAGTANPTELYDLATDPEEQMDRIEERALLPLVEHLSRQALLHRTVGSHRLTDQATETRITFDWIGATPAKVDTRSTVIPVAMKFDGQSAEGLTVKTKVISLSVSAVGDGTLPGTAVFSVNERGLGISSGHFKQVDDREALLISFDQDVIIESASIIAGNGSCGGFYRVGEQSPLAIYCIDADNDAKEQQGILSDIGVLPAGQSLRLDSSPHYGSESPGQWRLGNLSVRLLQD